MKIIILIIVVLLSAGCSMERGEAIQATKDCESAGMVAVPMFNGLGNLKDIICIPNKAGKP